MPAASRLAKLRPGVSRNPDAGAEHRGYTIVQPAAHRLAARTSRLPAPRILRPAWLQQAADPDTRFGAIGTPQGRVRCAVTVSQDAVAGIDTPGGRSATDSLVRKTTAGSISLACCSTEKADGTCLSPRSARVMRGAASHPIAAPRRRRSLSRDPPRFLLFFRLPLSRARHLRRSLIFAALTASPCPRGSGAGPSPAPCVR